ncbi:MAG: DUF364 domain-containing protein [Burkholderiaceae bacterium]|nr:hypothetical protein [Ottowia sp.]MCB2036800.1 hypothetical protein [Ottowia sp.]
MKPPVTQAVLRQLEAVARRLPAPRVARLHLPPRQAEACVGGVETEFCALELEDGAFGLAFVLLGDTLDRLLQRHGGAAPLAGADTLQLAQGLAERDEAARALGLAAVNALTASAWQRLGWQPPAAGNSLGDVQLTPQDHLGLIGNFTPLVRRVQEAGARLTVLELQQGKVERLQARFPGIHATTDRAALATCTQVVGTSTMLLNDTLDAMLAAAPAVREFVLIGPSAGLWPDALFDRGVTRVCGTQVLDGPAFAEALRTGTRWSDAARKFAIDRGAWPGWQTLLGLRGTAAAPQHSPNEPRRPHQSPTA